MKLYPDDIDPLPLALGSTINDQPAEPELTKADIAQQTRALIDFAATLDPRAVERFITRHPLFPLQIGVEPAEPFADRTVVHDQVWSGAKPEDRSYYSLCEGDMVSEALARLQNASWDYKWPLASPRWPNVRAENEERNKALRRLTDITPIAPMPMPHVVRFRRTNFFTKAAPVKFPVGTIVEPIGERTDGVVTQVIGDLRMVEIRRSTSYPVGMRLAINVDRLAELPF